MGINNILDDAEKKDDQGKTHHWLLMHYRELIILFWGWECQEISNVEMNIKLTHATQSGSVRDAIN
jgi:hypothetical protein